MKAKRQQQTLKLLIKWGHNPQDAARMIADNFENAFSIMPNATASKLADFIRVTDGTEGVER